MACKPSAALSAKVTLANVAEPVIVIASPPIVAVPTRASGVAALAAAAAVKADELAVASAWEAAVLTTTS